MSSSMSFTSSCFAAECLRFGWRMGRASPASIMWLYFLCLPLVTALFFKEVLIFGNDVFQCLRVSETHVWSCISYHFFQSFAELLVPSLFIDNCGPLFWLSVSYIGAFIQNLAPVGHINDADWCSRPGSDYRPAYMHSVSSSGLVR